MAEEYAYVEISDEDKVKLVAAGLADVADGVVTLNEKGDRMVREFAERKLREFAESAEPVDFYGGPFSNFEPSPITMDHPFVDGLSVTYPTVEHRFQAMKATTREDHDFVAGAVGPGEAKRRGRSIPYRGDWEEVKYDVMVEALRLKFGRYDFGPILLATGEREIREDSPTDFEWGYRNGGRNLLGKALMQVRSEIREASQQTNASGFAPDEYPPHERSSG